ncbi:hypothetical protein [Rhizobium sp. L1K21]|uniref:hypothetical protein n=1 Tax=Rhizobium sp. L1K21 TaxID=2954933 RepID=UPI002092E257|nr:hypothetical protein [Rhizobium sp. L1K21]MCO6188245.1 hypothetical protein [Rhizobium sp. L1K21]
MGVALSLAAGLPLTFVCNANSAARKGVAERLPIELEQCIDLQGEEEVLRDFPAPLPGEGALAAIVFTGVTGEPDAITDASVTSAPGKAGAKASFHWKVLPMLKLQAPGGSDVAYHRLYSYPAKGKAKYLAPSCAPAERTEETTQPLRTPATVNTKVDVQASGRELNSSWSNIVFLSTGAMTPVAGKDTQKWRLFETGMPIGSAENFEAFQKLASGGLLAIWNATAERADEMTPPLSAQKICALLEEAGSLSCDVNSVQADLTLADASAKALRAVWTDTTLVAEFIALAEAIVKENAPAPHAKTIEWADTAKQPDPELRSSLDAQAQDGKDGKTARSEAVETAKETTSDPLIDEVQEAIKADLAGQKPSEAAAETSTDAERQKEEAADTGDSNSVPPVANVVPEPRPELDAVKAPARYPVEYAGVPSGEKLQIAHFPDPLACESAFPYAADYPDAVLVAVTDKIEREPGGAAFLSSDGVAISGCINAVESGSGTSKVLTYSFLPIEVKGAETAVVLSLSNRFKASSLDLPIKGAIQAVYDKVSATGKLKPVSIYIIDGERTVRRVVKPETVALLAAMGAQQKIAHTANLMRSFDFSVRSMSALEDLKYVYRALEGTPTERVIYVADSSREDFDKVNTGPMFAWLYYDQVPVSIFSIGRCQQWEHMFASVGAGLTCRDVEQLTATPAGQTRDQLATAFLDEINRNH